MKQASRGFGFTSCLVLEGKTKNEHVLHTIPWSQYTDLHTFLFTVCFEIIGVQLLDFEPN